MDPRISELIHDLASDVEDVRRCAVIWLAQLDDASVLPRLEPLLDDPSPSVRQIAAQAVDQLRTMTARGIIIADGDCDAAILVQMIKSSDFQARMKGAAASYERRSPELASALASQLDVEAHPRVIALLVRALGSQQDPAVIPALRERLFHPDSLVRASAIEALAPYEDATTAEAVSLLAADLDTRVRTNVAVYFSRRDPARVRSIVLEMIASGQLWMKDGALHVLRTVGADWCRQMLEEMARQEPPGTALSRKLAAALREIAEREAMAPSKAPPHAAGASLAPVESGTTPAEQPDREPVSEEPPGADNDRSIVPLIATRFTPLTRELGEIAHFGQFVELLESVAPNARIHAIQNADSFPREVARRRLRELAGREDNPFAQATLARALGRIGDEEDVSRVRRFLESPDARVRANAIEALGQLGTPEALAIVEVRCEDESPRVRAAVAAIVARQGRRRGLDQLKEMLRSSEQRVAESALHALRGIGAPECLEILEVAIADESGPVRLKVLKVLEVLGDTNLAAREVFERYRTGQLANDYARDRLEQALLATNDRSADVRLAAIEKLVDFDDDEGRTRMELATADVDARVRRRAAALLAATSARDERRAALLRLGTATFKLSQTGGLPELGLGARIEEIAALGDIIDRGTSHDTASSLRDGRLRALAEVVLSEFDRGKVPEGALAGECRSAKAALDLVQSSLVEPATPAATDTAAGLAGVSASAGDAGQPSKPAPHPSSPAKPPSRPVAAPPGHGMLAAPRPASSPSRKAAQVLPPADLARRIASVAREYYLVLGAGLVSLAVFGLVVHGVVSRSVRPDHSVRRSPLPVSGVADLATIAGANSATRYTGRLVRWPGLVKEVNPARDRVLLEAGGYYFAAKLDTPLGTDVQMGAQAEVEGVVLERTPQGVVVLQGKRVQPTPPSARSPR